MAYLIFALRYFDVSRFLEVVYNHPLRSGGLNFVTQSSAY